VRPDVAGIDPGYQQRAVADDDLDGRLVPIASGIPGHDAAITIHNRSAALHVARLRPGDEIALPAAPFLHLFVARGSVSFQQAGLDEGDAVRLTESRGDHVVARESAELLVWEMHAGLGG
jgi:quercetin 2,3-dioxygenase